MRLDKNGQFWNGIFWRIDSSRFLQLRCADNGFCCINTSAYLKSGIAKTFFFVFEKKRAHTFALCMYLCLCVQAYTFTIGILTEFADWKNDSAVVYRYVYAPKFAMFSLVTKHTDIVVVITACSMSVHTHKMRHSTQFMYGYTHTHSHAYFLRFDSVCWFYFSSLSFSLLLASLSVFFSFLRVFVNVYVWKCTLQSFRSLLQSRHIACYTECRL